MSFKNEVRKFLLDEETWVIDQVRGKKKPVTIGQLAEWLVIDMGKEPTPDELAAIVKQELFLAEHMKGRGYVEWFLSCREKKCGSDSGPDSLAVLFDGLSKRVRIRREQAAEKVLSIHLDRLVRDGEIVEAHEWGFSRVESTPVYKLPGEARGFHFDSGTTGVWFTVQFNSYLLMDSLTRFTSKFMCEEMSLAHSTIQTTEDWESECRIVDVATFFYYSAEKAQAALKALTQNYQVELISSDSMDPAVEKPHCVYLLYSNKTIEQEYFTDEEYADFQGSDTPGGDYCNVRCYWTENEWSEVRDTIGRFDT